MKSLIYANHPDKAREILKWVNAIASRVPTEATIQTVTGSGPADTEAAKLLAAGLTNG